MLDIISRFEYKRFRYWSTTILYYHIILDVSHFVCLCTFPLTRHTFTVLCVPTTSCKNFSWLYEYIIEINIIWLLKYLNIYWTYAVDYFRFSFPFNNTVSTLYVFRLNYLKTSNNYNLFNSTCSKLELNNKFVKFHQTLVEIMFSNATVYVYYCFQTERNDSISKK